MKKLIITIVSIILILLSGVSWSASEKDFRESNRDNLIAICEYGYADYGTGALFECILTEFYGLDKVIDHIIETKRDTEDWDVLMNIMENNYKKEFDTYDFMAIDLDFREYLKEKKGN